MEAKINQTGVVTAPVVLESSSIKKVKKVKKGVEVTTASTGHKKVQTYFKVSPKSRQEGVKVIPAPPKEIPTAQEEIPVTSEDPAVEEEIPVTIEDHAAQEESYS